MSSPWQEEARKVPGASPPAPQPVDPANISNIPLAEVGTAPDKLNLAAAQLNSMKAHEFCTLAALGFWQGE